VAGIAKLFGETKDARDHLRILSTFGADVAVNFIGGIAAAGLVAFWVWIYNLSNNARIEADMRKGLKPSGFILGDTFGIPISNPSSSNVIIRQVLIGTQFGLIPLHHPWKKPHGPATSVKEAARMEMGFVELPPRTESVWYLGGTVFTMFPKDLEIKTCEVTVEYADLLDLQRRS
jgi:hypothetical protein